eukprot:358796-Chlamydomonas_euryale.AAC.18
MDKVGGSLLTLVSRRSVVRAACITPPHTHACSHAIMVVTLGAYGASNAKAHSALKIVIRLLHVGPTRMHEAVRRRHQQRRSGDDGDDADGSSWANAASSSWASPGMQDAQQSAGDAAAAFLSTLSKAIGEGSNALVARLKKVSSQPSIGQTTTFSEAADGVLSTIRHGLLPKSTLNYSRPPKPSSDAPSFYARTSVVTHGKDSGLLTPFPHIRFIQSDSKYPSKKVVGRRVTYFSFACMKGKYDLHSFRLLCDSAIRCASRANVSTVHMP